MSGSSNLDSFREIGGWIVGALWGVASRIYSILLAAFLSITDADYADDIAILANTPNQAETLLHSLEQAAAGIGLHVKAHKTKCALIKQAKFPH